MDVLELLLLLLVGRKNSGCSSLMPAALNRFDLRSCASTYTMRPRSDDGWVPDAVAVDAVEAAEPGRSGMEEDVGDEERFDMRYTASSRVSLISRLSRALVTMRTDWMRDLTTVLPVHVSTAQRGTTLWDADAGTRRTQLAAHLSHALRSLCQLLGQAPAVLVKVSIEHSAAHAVEC